MKAMHGLFSSLLFPSRDTCRLMIRKIQFAPANNKAGGKADLSKQFMMSDKPVHLEASLEKEVLENIPNAFLPL